MNLATRVANAPSRDVLETVFRTTDAPRQFETGRHMVHHVSDPGKDMPADRLASFKARDPVDSGEVSVEEFRRSAETC